MTTLYQPLSLRQALLADAIISGAFGLILLGGASLLADALALPVPLLRYAGLLSLPFAMFVAYVATRAQTSRAAVWSIIGINAMWVLGSIALLVKGQITPNAPGYAFMLFQALVVGLLAEFQFLALRRAAR